MIIDFVGVLLNGPHSLTISRANVLEVHYQRDSFNNTAKVKATKKMCSLGCVIELCQESDIDYQSVKDDLQPGLDFFRDSNSNHDSKDPEIDV